MTKFGVLGLGLALEPTLNARGVRLDILCPCAMETGLTAQISARLGATLGLALGGWVAANFGWRSAFFALAAPGLVLALLTILFVRKPQRGAWDAKTKGIEETASITQCVREFMANRTLLILLFSCASCSM